MTDLPPTGTARPSGDGDDPEHPTYQQLLDEALKETFPASDPISAAPATRPRRPCRTGCDEVDWDLEPGSQTPVPRNPSA